MTSRRWLMLSVLAIAASAAGGREPLSAQRAANPRAAARKEARQANKAGAPAERSARQQRLAGQVREAFARVVKQRLDLSDDQARRLKDLDDRYEVQRAEVARDEREARQALRDALAAPAGTACSGIVPCNAVMPAPP